MRKSPAKVLQDKGVDDIFPYLPINYGRAVLDNSASMDKYPDMTLARLQSVVRKRGTEPDWDAYNALLAIKKDAPVARRPRKKHKSRKPQLQAA